MEHYIKVESTQIYSIEISPEEAERLTGDYEQFDQISRRNKQVGFPLEFDKEIKLTFECSCGQRFRKPRTAREHLEEM